MLCSFTFTASDSSETFPPVCAPWRWKHLVFNPPRSVNLQVRSGDDSANGGSPKTGQEREQPESPGDPNIHPPLNQSVVWGPLVRSTSPPTACIWLRTATVQIVISLFVCTPGRRLLPVQQPHTARST